MAAIAGKIVAKIAIFAVSNLIEMTANKLFDLLVDDIISNISGGSTSIFSKKSPFGYG